MEERETDSIRRDWCKKEKLKVSEKIDGRKRN